MHSGCSMASRCYSYHTDGESDLHLFFSCPLAHQLWYWLLSQVGSPPAPPLSASSVWSALAMGVDSPRMKTAAAIFFQVINTLWFLRNEAKHRSKMLSLKKAQLVFQDRICGMFKSSSGMATPSHPILRALGWGDELSSFFPSGFSLFSWLQLLI
ncbi:hypothetical protein AAC387_Pa05g1783 [Persea americana]